MEGVGERHLSAIRLGCIRIDGSGRRGYAGEQLKRGRSDRRNRCRSVIEHDFLGNVRSRYRVGRQRRTVVIGRRAQVKLTEIFSPEVVITNLTSEDKYETFSVLVKLLSDAHGITDKDAVLSAVLERESKMSTGIREGIAVPHGKTGAVTKLCGAIGISRDGIDYDSLDGKPVHLVILLVSPADQSGPHLATLRSIALLLDDPNFLDEILESRSAAQVCELLRTYEYRTRG